MNTSSVRHAARSVTSPLRNFFNDHFEMVKTEIRSTDASRQVASLEAAVADLESDLVEQSLHHARALARVRADIEGFDARLAELERLIARLTDVVAASMVVDVDDATDIDGRGPGAG